jgi:hypothetical protein
MTAEVDQSESDVAADVCWLAKTVARCYEPRKLSGLIQTPLANLPNLYTKSRTAVWKGNAVLF